MPYVLINPEIQVLRLNQFPIAMTLFNNLSNCPSGDLYPTTIFWLISIIHFFRTNELYLDTLLILKSKGLSTNKRSALTAVSISECKRFCIPRASTRISGWLPLSKISRTSFSMANDCRTQYNDHARAALWPSRSFLTPPGPAPCGSRERRFWTDSIFFRCHRIP